MRTHAEAVDHLRAKGLHAEARESVLGETVVAAREQRDRAMVIVPGHTGWVSFEVDRPRPDDDVELPLAEACARVAWILTEEPCG